MKFLMNNINNQSSDNQSNKKMGQPQHPGHKGGPNQWLAKPS